MTNGYRRGGLTGFASGAAGRPMVARFLAPILIVAVTAALLAVSLVIKPELVISTDQIKYLTIAKNLAEGNGARDMGDPPGSFTSFRIGYTFCLATIIRIFGLSAGLVVAVNYLIFFVFVVLVYFLGLRLFGWMAGVLGTIFLVTIPEVIAYGPRNLDAFWPLLIIITTLLLVSSSERRGADTANGISAGIIAACAIMVKETSIFFLPVPVILLILGVRPPNARRVIWFYAGVAVVALFWIALDLLFLKLSTGSIWTGADISDMGITGWDLVSSFAGGLVKYFHNPEGRRQSFAFTRLPLAGVMVVALAWSLRLAFKGHSSHRTLLTVFTVFLPLSALAGALNLRFHQNFLFLVILCLILGAGASALVEAMTARFPGLLKKGYVATVVALVGAGALFNLLNKNSVTLAMEHFALTQPGSGLEIIYGGHKNVEALNGLPGGVVIAGDFFGELNRSLFLFGKGRASAPLPLRAYAPGEPVPAGAGAVVTRVFKDPARRDDAIFIFDADAFMKTLTDTRAGYVAVPGGMAAVAVWIEDNVGAEKTLAFPRRNEPPDVLIVLSKNRKPPAPSGAARKIYLSKATVDMLSRLKDESPAVHEGVVDWLFRRGLGLEGGAVSEIMEGKTRGARHVIVTPQQF